MKKLIAIVSMVLSIGAFASDKTTVSFDYSGFESYGRVYYACDYAEYETERKLEMFGATQIDVSCTGGIQFGAMWPVSVRATFVAPILVGNEMPAETVKDSGEACGLNTTIYRALLPVFSNVKVLKKSDSCAFVTSRYSYTFSIVK